MKVIICLLLWVNFAWAYDYQTPRSDNPYANQIKQTILSGHAISLSQHAIDSLLKRACFELHKRGEHQIERDIWYKWSTQYRYMLTEKRNIGDHKPLLDWLAQVTKALQSKLGIPLMNLLHLSDLITFNYAIPFIMDPCHFDITPMPEAQRQFEFGRHMAGDGTFEGLFPVLTYWATLTGTASMGPIAALLAGVAELSMDRFLAPELSDFVYFGSCH